MGTEQDPQIREAALMVQNVCKNLISYVRVLTDLPYGSLNCPFSDFSGRDEKSWKGHVLFAPVVQVGTKREGIVAVGIADSVDVPVSTRGHPPLGLLVSYLKYCIDLLLKTAQDRDKYNFQRIHIGELSAKEVDQVCVAVVQLSFR